MKRPEKEELVADLHGLFNEASTVIVTHYKGLKVAEMDDLRGRMKQEGAGFRVTKNRLTRLALKDTPFEGLSDLFEGPTAIAFSKDPVAAAKVTHEYARRNSKLQIIGGAFGETRLDPAGVESLAKMPSLDELRGKLVGILQTPAQRIVGATEAPAQQIARVLQARADEKGGEAA